MLLINNCKSTLNYSPKPPEDGEFMKMLTELEKEVMLLEEACHTDRILLTRNRSAPLKSIRAERLN